MFGILSNSGPVQFPDLLATMNGDIGLSGPVGFTDPAGGVGPIGMTGPLGFGSENTSDDSGYAVGLNLGVGVFA